MSPYIVTTKREAVPLARDFPNALPNGPDHVIRRAVATLEEARGKVDAAIRLYVKDGDEFARWIWASESLPESGGTIGPLPDGTVLYVEPQPDDFDVDAFNAREASA